MVDSIKPWIVNTISDIFERRVDDDIIKFSRFCIPVDAENFESKYPPISSKYFNDHCLWPCTDGKHSIYMAFPKQTVKVLERNAGYCCEKKWNSGAHYLKLMNYKMCFEMCNGNGTIIISVLKCHFIGLKHFDAVGTFKMFDKEKVMECLISSVVERTLHGSQDSSQDSIQSDMPYITCDEADSDVCEVEQGDEIMKKVKTEEHNADPELKLSNSVCVSLKRIKCSNTVNLSSEKESDDMDVISGNESPTFDDNEIGQPNKINGIDVASNSSGNHQLENVPVCVEDLLISQSQMEALEAIPIGNKRITGKEVDESNSSLNYKKLDVSATSTNEHESRTILSFEEIRNKSRELMSSYKSLQNRISPTQCHVLLKRCDDIIPEPYRSQSSSTQSKSSQSTFINSHSMSSVSSFNSSTEYNGDILTDSITVVKEVKPSSRKRLSSEIEKSSPKIPKKLETIDYECESPSLLNALEDNVSSSQKDCLTFEDFPCHQPQNSQTSVVTPSNNSTSFINPSSSLNFSTISRTSSPASSISSKSKPKIFEFVNKNTSSGKYLDDDQYMLMWNGLRDILSITTSDH